MTEQSTVGTATPASQRLDPAVVRIALAVVAGGIAVIFDTTIVGVALRQLATHLDTTVSTIQWVATGYLLAMFLAIPATGWLQARIGGKRLWLAALGVFLLGSVLCALAWDAPSLIAFRVLQGLGGGVMMPLMSTLIVQAAQGQPLGRLMAVIGLPASLGPILGPAIGGIILNWLDWRWLFLVNVPICAVGITLAVRILPDDRPADGPRPRLDVLGLLLTAPGVVGVIYGLSNVSKTGGAGRPDVWLPVVLGAVLVAGFVRWAWGRGSRALIDIRLFRHRPLAISTLLMLLMGFTLYGSMLLLPLFWQELRGHDALGAGLLLIPQGIGALVSRTAGGRATDDIGPRAVAVAGFAIIALATVPFAFADQHTGIGWLIAVLAVRGFGLGLVLTPLMGVAFVGLDRADVPHASIITRVAQQLGGSFGTAVLAVILERGAAGHPLAGAFDVAFWWASGFTALAVVVALVLPRRLAMG
jgi:EmrB/QacA subfamily drug resistance transporter